MRGRILVAGALVTSPARSLRKAWRQSQKYGPDVKKYSGIPVSRQFLDSYAIGVRHRVHPSSYYLCELHRESHRAEISQYLMNGEYRQLIAFLQQVTQPDYRLMGNKARFFEGCNERGLPTAGVIASFNGGSLKRWYPDVPRGELPHEDLISKPTLGTKGKGVTRYRFRDDRYHNDEGTAYTAEELLDRLAQLSVKVPQFLQPKLVNHVGLLPLTAAALSTARVVTFIDREGKAHFVGAVLRMPFGTGAADNFHQAGLASAIDEQTGKLGRAVRRRPDHPPDTYDIHPDTGTRITDFEVPCWREALQLCLDAQEAFPEFLSIGWDVAITEQGPALLEGNQDWGVYLLQQPYDMPIGKMLIEHYLPHFLEHPRVKGAAA